MPARRAGVPTRPSPGRGRQRGLLLVACAVALVGAVASPTGARSLGAGGGEGVTPTVSTPPNIVLILTDDQRFDEMARMPIVSSQIVNQGINFTNAFVVNPSCCPSRTTILTGKYSHGTDIYTNKPPHGGFQTFLPEESSTLATWLHDAGYHTGLVGKYLNGYDATSVAHVPPGWDRWVALTLGSSETGPVGYYNYTLSVDGTAEFHGTGSSNYSTTVLGQDATAFIQSAPQGQPLFLYFAPYAPHSPTKVDKQYKTACAGLPPNRPPSFNEADTSDKPKYVRRRALLTTTDIAKIDRHHLADCRSLLSVDDQVGNIVNALQSTGRLSNTLLVFMSDNGYLFGEHRRTGKIVPYEESIRVPMAVRYDPVTAPLAGTTNADLVLNLDIAPTFAAAAGVTPPAGWQFDGQSMLPLFTDPSAAWRDHFLIEHWGEGGVPAYCAVRSATWKYVLYATGEEELYDLSADPYELVNQASNPDPVYQNQLVAMRAQEQTLCQPQPPGGLP
jgi:N-acetylglucosamine-6-sulfatase